ncbi:hypothetical protein [Planctomicrobium sp. SH664]|uniref:hypothetical protein n=1 Tax=Planctomicrobium sp. SH664 TaxID=3448125 RepID=UPI003F5C446F
MRPRLRLFNGEDDLNCVETPTMTISFGELATIIEEAGRLHRAWLRDFSHDDVQIPEDLYEVLTEYSRLRPGA